MQILKFTVPVPTSSKNSRQLTRTKSGGMRSLPNAKARKDKDRVAGIARHELVRNHAGIFDGPPLFEDDDVEVRMEFDPGAQVVHVEVERLRPKPEEHDGRERDLDNLASTILDALSGVAYRDDKQVALLQVERT